jgi:hypothetical protein
MRRIPEHEYKTMIIEATAKLLNAESHQLAANRLRADADRELKRLGVYSIHEASHPSPAFACDGTDSVNGQPCINVVVGYGLEKKFSENRYQKVLCRECEELRAKARPAATPEPTTTADAVAQFLGVPSSEVPAAPAEPAVVEIASVADVPSPSVEPEIHF